MNILPRDARFSAIRHGPNALKARVKVRVSLPPPVAGRVPDLAGDAHAGVGRAGGACCAGGGGVPLYLPWSHRLIIVARQATFQAGVSCPPQG